MKITLNGTKVRAYKGVDKNNRPYQFIVVGGSCEDGKTARAVFNNRGLYSAIAKSGISTLDTVEVVASTTREHKFTGRDGSTVSIIETVDPLPTGVERSAFPTTEKWPEWGDLMKAASASKSTDATAAGSDSEAEF